MCALRTPLVSKNTRMTSSLLASAAAAVQSEGVLDALLLLKIQRPTPSTSICAISTLSGHAPSNSGSASCPVAAVIAAAAASATSAPSTPPAPPATSATSAASAAAASPSNSGSASCP